MVAISKLVLVDQNENIKTMILKYKVVTMLVFFR